LVVRNRDTPTYFIRHVFVIVAAFIHEKEIAHAISSLSKTLARQDSMSFEGAFRGAKYTMYSYNKSLYPIDL